VLGGGTQTMGGAEGVDGGGRQRAPHGGPTQRASDRRGHSSRPRGLSGRIDGIRLLFTPPEGSGVPPGEGVHTHSLPLVFHRTDLRGLGGMSDAVLSPRDLCGNGRWRGIPSHGDGAPPRRPKARNGDELGPTSERAHNMHAIRIRNLPGRHWCWMPRFPPTRVSFPCSANPGGGMCRWGGLHQRRASGGGAGGRRDPEGGDGGGGSPTVEVPSAPTAGASPRRES